MRTGSSLSNYELIWETVRQIPKGSVATYGEVAAESGLPGQPRLVGYALHRLPAGSDVPWHRVINSQGRILFSPASRVFKEQRRLLQKEGVVFAGEAVDLHRFGWLKDLHRQ